MSPTRPDLLAMLDADGRLLGWGTVGPTAVRLVQAVDHRGVPVEAGQYNVCPICQALIRELDIREVPGAATLVIEDGTPKLVFTEAYYAAMREHEQVLLDHTRSHSAEEWARASQRLLDELDRLRRLLALVDPSPST
jgi:hypothetical protein